MFKRFFIILPFLAFFFYSCESNDNPIIINSGGNFPVLLVPPNNSTINTTSPVFDWTDFPLAVSYRFQLSADASFNSLILDESGLSNSEFTVPASALNDSSNYFWRVKAALQSADTTEWSNANSFTIVLSSISPTSKVLVELFTNTSCIPCVPANIYLDDIHDRLGITSNDANVIILRVHTTLFSGDPFYEFNPADNAARMNYYNAASVNPRGFLLGTSLGQFSASAWTNKINEKLANLRSFAIEIQNSYNASSRNGDVSLRIKQESGLVVSDLVLHVAVAENEIQYNAPNGETHFENTLRDLITHVNGESVTISSGQTNSYNYSYSINAVVNASHSDIIVFLQSISTKEVFAVELAKIIN